MSKITFEVPFSYCVPPLDSFFNSDSLGGLQRDWDREYPLEQESVGSHLQVTNLGPDVKKFLVKDLFQKFSDPYITRAVSRYQEQAQYVMCANSFWSGGNLNKTLILDGYALRRTTYQDFTVRPDGEVIIQEQSLYNATQGWVVDLTMDDGKRYFDIGATLYEERAVTFSWRTIDEVIKDIDKQGSAIKDPDMPMNTYTKEIMERRIQLRRDQFVAIKKYFEDIKQLKPTNESLLSFIQQYISSTFTLNELTTQLDQANKEQKITVGDTHYIYGDSTLYQFIERTKFQLHIEDTLGIKLTEEEKKGIKSHSEVPIHGYTFDSTLDGWKKRDPINMNGLDLLGFMQQQDENFTRAELDRQLAARDISVAKEWKITVGGTHYMYGDSTLYRFIDHTTFQPYLEDTLGIELTEKDIELIKSGSEVTIGGHTFDRTRDGWKERDPIKLNREELLDFMKKQDKNFTQADLEKQLPQGVDKKQYPFSMQRNGMLLPQFWKRGGYLQPLEIRLQDREIEVVCPPDYQSKLLCMLDTDIIANSRIYNPELGIDSDKLPDGSKEKTELPLLDIEYMMGVCEALAKHDTVSDANKCKFAEDLARYKLRPLRDEGLLLDVNDQARINRLKKAFLDVDKEEKFPIYRAKIDLIFVGLSCSRDLHSLKDEESRTQRYSKYTGWGTSCMLILMAIPLSISALMPTLLPAAVMLGLFKIALPIVFGLLACACVYKHQKAEMRIENIQRVQSDNFRPSPMVSPFQVSEGAGVTPTPTQESRL